METTVTYIINSGVHLKVSLLSSDIYNTVADLYEIVRLP